MNLVLVLGNQLFDPKVFEGRGIDPRETIFFMREDAELASYFRFHKHKIILFFAAMRAYRDELQGRGYDVHYEALKGSEKRSGGSIALKDPNALRAPKAPKAPTSETDRYETSLTAFIKSKKIKKVFCFEIEDKFFEKRIIELCKSTDIALEFWPSPMFLTSREEFQSYLRTQKRPFMKTFYERQRKRLNVLMKGTEPIGGAWSFDSENRLPLPKGQMTPALPMPQPTKSVSQVIELVETAFSNHPGDGKDFWLPVDRDGAREWLKTFLKERLINFGPYEDAIPKHSEFVFHSVLTPFLNCGLLTPHEVIEETLNYAKKHEVPFPSLEGFIRQVIGWREFIRGIYQNFSERQYGQNFWGHHNRLSSAWYEGNTGVPPLDETILRVRKRGYAHHIERLMIVGSLMVLLEVDPKEAYRWFMEMFIDSSDWVMGPNVFGMAIFSDGGVFATKPYICGSNYLCKMGGYAKGDWCHGVDGLYWEFIKKHEQFFLKNPRLSMMARSAQKITADRWKVLHPAASDLRRRLVVSP